MIRYKNAAVSGVAMYEAGLDYIKIKFSKGTGIYTYSYHKAGKEHVERMKELAALGRGLNTYINEHTKNLFDE